jgi:hypothetical protein
MKKLVLLSIIVLSGVFASAQTDSIGVQEFFKEFTRIDSAYRENYDKKNWKNCENKLFEGILLFNRQHKEEQNLNPQIIAGLHYNVACIYSLQNQKKKAVEYFEKSIKLGYNDYYHILEDSDLDNIRKEKRFVLLLKELSEGTYLSILKQTGGYEKTDTVDLPHFYYEIPENARMQDIKTYFKLDSIAGDGDEISKILNIMYWIHNNIRHDGSNYALAEFDAIDLYHYHKATGKGINCRHLAIALNEMYLSMGWKSRYVTCMPKDENDQDCHVINSVWIDHLQKWIWIDPTFAAYVKDENDNLLSISEVRQKLIDDSPLLLNEDANWNNQSKQTKEGYLMNYMAKNLYWLQVSINNIFNPESRYRNKVNEYVSLLPVGYTRSNTNNTGTITSDSEYFWQKPENSK